MRLVAIIQARMGSTRLPGKILQEIAGQSMLSLVVKRTQLAPSVDEVVVATTTSAMDDAVVEECRRLGVPVFRGNEQDVLDRYYRASVLHHAETVVRITSDCPLIDPGVVGQVVSAFLSQMPDYASNTLQRTFPRGLDTEAVTAEGIARAWREAREPYQRAHVTPYFFQNPDLFRLLSVTGDADCSGYRWTVDTPEDLVFVRAVYEHFDHPVAVTWRDVLKLMADEPGLAELNRSIQQKALHEG